MDKAAQFLATRIGQDALAIADLLQQNEKLRVECQELEKKLAEALANKGEGSPA